MKIWYTADTHFGHENVIKFCNRPFRSTNQMDRVQLKNMHEIVGPEDQLWVLEDFAFGQKSSDSAYLEMIFAQLPGAEKHLIIGNHDLQPTLDLPWTSASHYSELRDGHKSNLTRCAITR